ncbi:hypothetical protein NBRC116495_22950 [Aurantivibrio plasticivorans]
MDFSHRLWPQALGYVVNAIVSRLIFNLHQVPPAEAAAVKRLLDENHVAYYETSPGFWGTGVHGLWLIEGAVIEAAASQDAEEKTRLVAEPLPSDEQRLAEAKSLIIEFQEGFAQKARDEHRQSVIRGRAPSFWGNVKQKPVKALLLIFFVSALIALLISPLWLFTAL